MGLSGLRFKLGNFVKLGVAFFVIRGEPLPLEGSDHTLIPANLLVISSKLMEKKSPPTSGQHKDGHPSESPLAAQRSKVAEGDQQTKRPPPRKKRTAELLCAKRYTFLHRIAEVRLQQGVSLRNISRRTGLPVRELRDQEQPQSNLTLRDLHIWKDALEVPLELLLVDSDMSVPQSIRSRALLIRIMKTVMSLRALVMNRRLIILLDTLRQQLVELMPELNHIGSWPMYGSQRNPDDYGRIAEEPVTITHLAFLGD